MNKCENCPYPDSMYVGMQGAEDGDYVVVAEFPADVEERTGIPLIEPSGMLLRMVIVKALGYKPEVYILLSVVGNAPGPKIDYMILVACRPSEGNTSQ